MSETVTIAGYTRTIYGTVAARDELLLTSQQFYVKWQALTADARNRISVDVARRLDQKPWAGEKVSPSQALAWPRTGAFGTNVTPANVELASYLWAGYMALNPALVSASASGATGSLQSLKEGPVAAAFFAPLSTLVELAPGDIAEIEALIVEFYDADATLGALLAPFASLGLEESKFECYDLTQGLS